MQEKPIKKPGPGRARWLVIGLVLALLLVAYLIYGNLFGSDNLDLDEIAGRLGMQCAVSEIDRNRELFGIKLADILRDPVSNCDWDEGVYEVATREDLDSLADALIDKLPETTGRDQANLVESCQSLIFSANIDNLVREKLVLTPKYAFVNFSGVANLRAAMEAENIGLSSIPSTCDEFLARIGSN